MKLSYVMIFLLTFYIAATAQMIVRNSSGTGLMSVSEQGNVAIGTAAGNTRLNVVAPGTSTLSGTAMSNALKVSAGTLPETRATEMHVASLGYQSGQNSVALGVHAYRSTQGTDINSNWVYLSMDIDDAAGQSSRLWFGTNNTITVNQELTVSGLSGNNNAFVLANSSGKLLRGAENGPGTNICIWISGCGGNMEGQPCSPSHESYMERMVKFGRGYSDYISALDLTHVRIRMDFCN